jgi:hypothetical protein
MFSSRELLYQVPDSGLDCKETHFGNFSRGSLILAPAADYHEPESIFLNKILEAVHTNLERDCLLVLPPASPWAVLPILKTRKPERVLVFGLSPSAMGLQAEIPKYAPTFFYGTSWLFSDSLQMVAGSAALKSNLWKALQTLFSAP